MQGCRPFTQAEVRALARAAARADRWRDRALILLGVRTGYRISELLSLQVRDVATNGRTPLYIRKWVTVRAAAMKGKHKPRTAAIPDDASRALRDWIKRHPAPSPKAAVFCGRDPQRPISRIQAHRILLFLCRAARIPRALVATHSLRKTFAHVAFRALGKDLRALSRLLGHQRLKTTQEYLSFRELSAWERLYPAQRKKRLKANRPKSTNR